jgi:hypothetical protein
MDKLIIREIAEQACAEQNLMWSVSSVSPNPDNGNEWEVYYDAFGRKYHKILIRITPKADSTRESVKAEIGGHLRELKYSGRL